jgi:hypothetical protein
LLLTGWGTSLAGPLRGRRDSSGGGSSGNSTASVAILEKIAVHFPILEPSIALNLPLRDQLVQLNVSAAQLLVRFLPEVMAAGVGAQSQFINQNQAPNEPLWALRLLDWLQGVMASGIALPAAEDDLVGGGGGGRGEGVAGAAATGNETKQSSKKKKNKKSTTADPSSKTTMATTTAAALASAKTKSIKSATTAVPAAVYAAALSAVEDILPLLPPSRRREMLAAAWSLWNRTQIKSASRAKTLAFFSRLLSTPAASLYTPLPPTGEPLVLQEEAAAWVAAMPRFLWELGTAAPLTTIEALQFLLDAARYSVLNSATSTGDGSTSTSTTNSPLQSVLSGLHPQLTPLFGILMPSTKMTTNQKSGTSGGSGSSSGVFTPGPLAALPESTQWLAIDILYHLPGLPESTLNTIAYVALGGGKFPNSTIVRCIDLAIFKASEADSAQFWGILLALISGVSRSGVEKGSEGKEEGWNRHEVVVEAGCRAAVSAAGGTQDALAALGPALLDVYKEKMEENSSVGVSKVLYGLFTLCSTTLTSKDAATSTTAAVVLAALPEAFLDYVRICIECAAEDPVEHVSRPRAAATAAVMVVAVQSELLAPTLGAATASISNSDKNLTKSAIEAVLLLLLEIASNSTLESELVKCSSEAEIVVKAIKSTIEKKDGGVGLISLRNGLHRLLALMSQKLGIEF